MKKQLLQSLPALIGLLLAIITITAGPRAAPQGERGIAVINTEAFAAGIAEYKKELDKLEMQLQPRLKEIQELQTRFNRLNEEFRAKESTLSPRAYKQSVLELTALKREADRKVEDYEFERQRMTEQLLAPARDKVLTYLNNYSNARNIAVVLDLPVAAQHGLLYFNAATNITDDFIKEYNQRASSAPARP